MFSQSEIKTYYNFYFILVFTLSFLIIFEIDPDCIEHELTFFYNPLGRCVKLLYMVSL